MVGCPRRCSQPAAAHYQRRPHLCGCQLVRQGRPARCKILESPATQRHALHVPRPGLAMVRCTGSPERGEGAIGWGLSETARSSCTSWKACAGASEPWAPNCAIGPLGRACHLQAVGYCHTLMRATPRPSLRPCAFSCAHCVQASQSNAGTARPSGGCSCSHRIPLEVSMHAPTLYGLLIYSCNAVPAQGRRVSSDHRMGCYAGACGCDRGLWGPK